LTPSGQQKQLTDERAAWTTLKNNAIGTPMHGQITALATWDVAGNATNITTAAPAYQAWREAHKSLTKRARLDRQREQAAVANNAAHPVGLPFRVSAAAVMRDTIRVAVLYARTSEDNGGGTMLIAGSNQKSTTQDLMRRLDQTLGAIEEALRDPVQHRDEADLRAGNRPPVQILLSSEWYFRMPGRPYTQAERDAIVNDLRALSRKYPEWLIVPGSIYWSPDNQTLATIRVYNQAVALFCGEVIKSRTKRESHDIDSDLGVRAKERWGPDWSDANGGPVIPDPVAITAESREPAIFDLKGRDYCVEICRDQWVGDAVKGYLNHAANNTGADIYLFTSNGTTWQSEFCPARNNGIAVWCDGSGAGSQAYYQITRPNPLNHNPPPFNAFRVAFEADRTHDVRSSHGFNEATLIERSNNPAFQNFMARFDPIFPLFGAASSNLGFQAPIDAAIAATPLAGGAAMNYHKKGLRIQQVLAGGNLAGTPITGAENAVMTPYANALILFGNEDRLLSASKPTTDGLKITAKAARVVNATALNPGNVNVPGIPNLRVYDLVNL